MAQRRFDYADTLAFQIKTIKLPVPIREFRPYADRKWRLDLAWPDRWLFVECDGGEFLRASARRHGGAADCERWNRLMLDGWRGFRFVGTQIKSGEALTFLEKLFNGQGAHESSRVKEIRHQWPEERPKKNAQEARDAVNERGPRVCVSCVWLG